MSGETISRKANCKRLGGAAVPAIVAALLLVALSWSPASATAAARGARVALGAYVPHGDQSPSVIAAFGEQVGWKPQIVDSYKTFDQVPVYLPQLSAIRRNGAVPMVTWEPQTSSGGRIQLSEIARGRYDGYLRAAARAAVSWGGPLMIRFGQEMNGRWFPWSPSSGNSPHSYVMAWRHIVRLFRAEGAHNVRWVWTPYVNLNGGLPFTRFYPGNRYVDWAGLDGYNWGGSFPWQSFRNIFSASYKELLRITSRPLLIGEVGCGAVGGSKAAWLRSMLRQSIPRMTHIRAVVWFDAMGPSGDLRVNTSNAALHAFRRWTHQRLYTLSGRLLLQTPHFLSRISSPLAPGQ